MFGKSEVQKGGLGFVDKEEVWEEFKLDEPEKCKEKEKPKEMKHAEDFECFKLEPMDKDLVNIEEKQS